MAENKESKLRTIIDNMTIEEKAGQCLVVDFTGISITPHLIDLIERCNCAGLRVQSDCRIKSIYHSGAVTAKKSKERSFRHPKDGCKDLAYGQPAPSCRASEYASVLNKVKQIAMNRKHGIPLHITLDQEGAGYENFICGNVRQFPSPMGVAATNDSDLAYKAYRVMARQLKLSGFSWIHSPVLDVNTNPLNPEIGIRAFSDTPKTVAKFGMAMLKAFQAEKIITTGKHFPGRGESAIDAHADLPTIDISRDELMNVHLAPYKALIAEGLPSVMLAHTIYPALDSDPVPATTSRKIITGVLREELGFEGAITTDNMLMSGLIKKYEILEASILALKGGATLILPRVESPLINEIYDGIVAAIKSGRLPEKLIDEAIYHNLSVKYDYGLFDDGGIVDPAKADAYQDDADAQAVEDEVGQKSVTLLRDDLNILPISPDKNVLLIDQTGGAQVNFNNFSCHPGIFWEQLLEISKNVRCVELKGSKIPDDEEEQRVLRRMEEADIIIAANYEIHRQEKFNTALLEKIKDKGKPMIVVTNSPYKTSDAFETVLVLWTDAPASTKAAGEIIFGKRDFQAKMPIARYK